MHFNPLPLSEFLIGHECLKRNCSRYRVNSHSGLPPVRNETVSIFGMLCFPNHAFIFIAIIPGRKQHIPGPFPSNMTRSLPRAQPLSLSRCKFAPKGRRKGETLLFFRLPVVPRPFVTSHSGFALVFVRDQRAKTKRLRSR